MATLTAEQAYEAMFCYLSEYWKRFEHAALGDVLGDMQPAKRGTSSDPAAWEDWLKCVRRVAGEHKAV